jgi:predicted porin
MKKTLVAIAALASVTAFAQTTATITGVFDTSLANQKSVFGDASTRSFNSLLNSQQGTSQINFALSEDLGGGLKAIANLEQDFNASSKSDVANLGAASNVVAGNKSTLGGQTFVGLEGGFGTIKLGAQNTPSLAIAAGRTPFGTKIGSGFSDGTSAHLAIQGLGHVRESNSIEYSTPVVSGLQLRANFTGATSAYTADNRNDAAVAAANAKRDVGVSYVNGPVSAMIVNYKQNEKYNQVHGFVSYALGDATVTYGFSNDSRLAATAAATTYSAATGQIALVVGTLASTNIAGTYKMGATTLMANYAKLDDKGTTNYDGKITAVGAKYDLSKRTSAYARYIKQTVSNTSVSIHAKEQTTSLFGLMHTF